jgi:hypothetical protein
MANDLSSHFVHLLLKKKLKSSATKVRSLFDADGTYYEIFHFSVCLPARCGRVVNDGLVTPEESHALLKLAKKGLAKGGSNGGASIIDLHSGALSSDDHFINLYKQYPGLFEPRDFTVYRTVKDRIKNYLADHFEIDPTSLYLTHPTFFSRLDNKPAKTMHDEYWHLHIDKETYPSFHYTSLLYLTDHGDDFQGGEFVFVDTHDKLNRYKILIYHFSTLTILHIF